MQPLTGAQQVALQESHTAVHRVDVLRADQKLQELMLIGGDVTTEEGVAIEGSTHVALVDPTGELTVTDTQSLLSPFGTEIQVWRGVDTGDPDNDYISQGIFRVTGYNIHEAAGGIVTTLTGFDRALRCEGSLDHGFPIPAGISYEAAVMAILLEKLPTLRFRMQKTGLTTLSLYLATDKSVWAEARRIARSVGCRLYFDRRGICVMAPIQVQAQATKVWDYIEGDNALFWDIDRNLYVDDLANVVVVQSTNTAGVGVQGEARDLDPRSPTYSNGPYGQVVYAERTELVLTSGQARTMAQGILAQKLGASEVVTFSAVPNPALDIGDTISVTREALGIDHRLMIVQRIVLPLTAAEPMVVTCRRSVLTSQDQWQQTATVDA